MNKHYNENDFLNNVSELAIKTTGECAGDVIQNLANIEKKDNTALADTLKEVGYSMVDVAEFTTIKDKASFTVWVGGVEVNDHKLTLSNACDMASYWTNEKSHDDVHVCTIT
jgi:repressor of nif and glnA expression